MSGIESDLEMERYMDGNNKPRRHLSDAVLRTPLRHLDLREPLCVRPAATLRESVNAMMENRRGFVVVTAEKGDGGGVVGIFTERDVLLRVVGKEWKLDEHPVSEVMTPAPECLPDYECIGYALNKMVVRGYRHIPVVDDKKRPVAAVSIREITQYLCEFFPEEVINYQADPSAPNRRYGG